MEKKELNAIHEKDLENFLKALGYWNDFIYGDILCCYCKKVINNENLLSIIPSNNEVIFSCSSPNCYEKLIEFRR